jgi:hypothetical protein
MAKPMEEEAIHLAAASAERLKVVLPYHPDRIAKIKTVAGRRWPPKERYWTVPRPEEALAALLALLAGEPVEMDPSLRPMRTPDHREPPHPKLLDQARQAMRTRHYS